MSDTARIVRAVRMHLKGSNLQERPSDAFAFVRPPRAFFFPLVDRRFPVFPDDAAAADDEEGEGDDVEPGGARRSAATTVGAAAAAMAAVTTAGAGRVGFAAGTSSTSRGGHPSTFAFWASAPSMERDSARGFSSSFAASSTSRASSAREGGSGSDGGSGGGSEGAGAGAFARANRTVSVDRLLENLTRPTSSDAHAGEGHVRAVVRAAVASLAAGLGHREHGQDRRRARADRLGDDVPGARTPGSATSTSNHRRRPRRRRRRSTASKPRATPREAPSPPRARRVRGGARDRPARRGLPS